MEYIPLERDYQFQTYMKGKQWAQAMGTFKSDEKTVLWRQKGRYIGGARLEHHRLHHHETVKYSYSEMTHIALSKCARTFGRRNTSLRKYCL